MTEYEKRSLELLQKILDVILKMDRDVAHMGQIVLRLDQKEGGDGEGGEEEEDALSGTPQGFVDLSRKP